MKKFLFADLDDTLFGSAGRIAADLLEPAARRVDGTVCSYTTPTQRALLALFGETTLIPTTARDLAALRRVAMQFTSYAVIDHGGVVLLPGGEPDLGWLERMRAALHPAIGALDVLRRRIEAYVRRAGDGIEVRIVEDFGVPFFLAVKDSRRRPERLARVRDELVDPWSDDGNGEYVVHLHGGRLAVLPACVGKAHAVRHVVELLRQECGPVLTIGAGDSVLDARFMAHCDYALVPRETQLSVLTVEAL